MIVMMQVREVIVVEGRDDTTAIRRAVDADTIETGGSALNEETLSQIRLLQQKRGVIVFTDPDYPGERIRKQISRAVPGCKHAFLPIDLARSKEGKIGVEYARPQDIRTALAGVRTEGESSGTELTWADCVAYGLVGGGAARESRRKIGRALGIGYVNAKQFFKRLQLFGITKEEFEAAYRRLKKGARESE
jgi:ribonuclease M5